MEPNNMKWKPVLTIAAGSILLLFFLCEIGMHYQNIGSLTGAAASLVLILLGGISFRTDRPEGIMRTVYRILKWTTVVLLIPAILASGFIGFGIPQRTAPSGTPVVILGSGVNSDGSPSEVMQRRVDAALEYLKEDPDAMIIVSGSQLGDAPVNEAESMRNALTAEGIQEERILCEDRSKTTAENMKYTAELMRENNLGTDIVLVTSRFHLARACAVAEQNGLKAYPLGASTPWWALPSYWIREIYAVIALILKR